MQRFDFEKHFPRFDPKIDLNLLICNFCKCNFLFKNGISKQKRKLLYKDVFVFVVSLKAVSNNILFNKP